MVLQILAVLMLCYAILSGRLIGVQTAVAGTQIIHIRDVVIQTGKYQIRLFAGLLTYPLQIRCHRLFTLCMMPVFLLGGRFTVGTFAQRGLAASQLGHCGAPVPITRDAAIP
jgi:hypothetical protein